MTFFAWFYDSPPPDVHPAIVAAFVLALIWTAARIHQYFDKKDKIFTLDRAGGDQKQNKDTKCE
jgi:hypothetical protein